MNILKIYNNIMVLYLYIFSNLIKTIKIKKIEILLQQLIYCKSND